MPTVKLVVSSNIGSLAPEVEKALYIPLLSALTSALSEQLGFSHSPDIDQAAQEVLADLIAEWISVSSQVSGLTISNLKTSLGQICVSAEVRLLGRAIDKKYHSTIISVVENAIRSYFSNDPNTLDLRVCLLGEDDQTIVTGHDGAVLQTAEILEYLAKRTKTRLAYWALGMAV